MSKDNTRVPLEIYDTAREISQWPVTRRNALIALASVPIIGGLWEKLALIRGQGKLSMRPAMYGGLENGHGDGE